MSRRDALTALGALAIPEVAAGAEPSVVMPMHREADRFWMEGQLNGVGPLELLVGFLGDAGQITQELAERCKLNKLFDVEIEKKGQTEASLYRARVLKLGNVLDIAAALFVGVPNPRGWPDAAINLNFVRGSFGFDFDRDTLTFLHRQPSLAGFEPLEMGRRRENRLRPDANIRIVVQVDGSPATLSVAPECGPGLQLYSDYVRKRRLWDRGGGFITSTTQETFGQSVVDRLVRLDALEVGETKIERPIARVSDPNAGEGIAGSDGYIGLEMLRRFNFWICREPTVVAFRPNAHLHDPINYDRSGYDTATEGGVRRIVATLAGGPAEKAGLRVGDVIDESREAARRAASPDNFGAPGSGLEVRVLRDGLAQTHDLVLEELL